MAIDLGESKDNNSNIYASVSGKGSDGRYPSLIRNSFCFTLRVTKTFCLCYLQLIAENFAVDKNINNAKIISDIKKSPITNYLFMKIK